MKTNKIFKTDQGTLRIMTPNGEVLDHLVESMTIRESGKGCYIVTLDLFCTCDKEEENEFGVII